MTMECPDSPSSVGEEVVEMTCKRASPTKGVTYHRQSGSWRAETLVDGRKKYRYFSVRKFGGDAWRRAVTARQDWESEQRGTSFLKRRLVMEQSSVREEENKSLDGGEFWTPGSVSVTAAAAAAAAASAAVELHFSHRNESTREVGYCINDGTGTQEEELPREQPSVHLSTHVVKDEEDWSSEGASRQQALSQKSFHWFNERNEFVGKEGILFFDGSDASTASDAQDTTSRSTSSSSSRGGSSTNSLSGHVDNTDMGGSNNEKSDDLGFVSSGSNGVVESECHSHILGADSGDAAYPELRFRGDFNAEPLADGCLRPHVTQIYATTAVFHECFVAASFPRGQHVRVPESRSSLVETSASGSYSSDGSDGEGAETPECETSPSASDSTYGKLSGSRRHGWNISDEGFTSRLPSFDGCEPGLHSWEKERLSYCSSANPSGFASSLDRVCPEPPFPMLSSSSLSPLHLSAAPPSLSSPPLSSSRPLTLTFCHHDAPATCASDEGFLGYDSELRQPWHRDMSDELPSFVGDEMSQLFPRRAAEADREMPTLDPLGSGSAELMTGWQHAHVVVGGKKASPRQFPPNYSFHTEHVVYSPGTSGGSNSSSTRQMGGLLKGCANAALRGEHDRSMPAWEVGNSSSPAIPPNNTTVPCSTRSAMPSAASHPVGPQSSDWARAGWSAFSSKNRQMLPPSISEDPSESPLPSPAHLAHAIEGAPSIVDAPFQGHLVLSPRDAGAVVGMDPIEADHVDTALSSPSSPLVSSRHPPLSPLSQSCHRSLPVPSPYLNVSVSHESPTHDSSRQELRQPPLFSLLNGEEMLLRRSQTDPSSGHSSREQLLGEQRPPGVDGDEDTGGGPPKGLDSLLSEMNGVCNNPSSTDNSFSQTSPSKGCLSQLSNKNSQEIGFNSPVMEESCVVQALKGEGRGLRSRHPFGANSSSSGSPSVCSSPSSCGSNSSPASLNSGSFPLSCRSGTPSSCNSTAPSNCWSSSVSPSLSPTVNPPLPPSSWPTSSTLTAVRRTPRTVHNGVRKKNIGRMVGALKAGVRKVRTDDVSSGTPAEESPTEPLPQGVCFCPQSGVWQASVNLRGRRKKRRFSVSKYGHSEARRQAIRCRLMWNRMLADGRDSLVFDATGDDCLEKTQYEAMEVEGATSDHDDIASPPPPAKHEKFDDEGSNDDEVANTKGVLSDE